MALWGTISKQINTILQPKSDPKPDPIPDPIIGPKSNPIFGPLNPIITKPLHQLRKIIDKGTSEASGAGQSGVHAFNKVATSADSCCS